MDTKNWCYRTRQILVELGYCGLGLWLGLIFGLSGMAGVLLGGYVGQEQIHFGQKALRLPAKNVPTGAPCPSILEKHDAPASTE